MAKENIIIIKYKIMKYTLSFYVKENHPFINKLKWFEFWKKRILIDNYVYVRKIANFKNENEKECLKLLNSEMFKEIIKQTNNEVNNLQLELGNDNNTNYINCSNLF